MIYTSEHHDQVLAAWRSEDRRGIRLAHVDFHDDLRGLLVDRRRRRAYPLGKLARGEAPCDAGNFLAHAVLEQRVDGIRWIHGAIGGRAWDAGIVRYESDWLATHHRLAHALRGGREVPLEFEEIVLDRWGGLTTGELLSIDWDCFASRLLDAQGIASRVDAFVGRLGTETPAATYLVYSPEYSHPSLEAFHALARRLADRFGQKCESLSPGLASGRLEPSGVDGGLPRGVAMRLILALRRRGIY